MNLLSFDARLTKKEIEELHTRHLNSGLVQLLGLINLNRDFVAAENCEVWDRDGNKYLDFLGGYGSLNLGHNPRVISNALIEVIKGDDPNMLHTSLSKFQAILAHNLAEVAPGKLQRSFFSNSGAESVEGAIKFARAATKRQVILSLEGSFHGKTMGALSLTGKPSYQEPFLPMLPKCEIVRFGSIEMLADRLSKGDVAGFIVEPILGEGGVKLHPEGYLKKAQELCRQYKTLFIVDEVQTGFGRTGKLFACEHDNLEPDIMCLAKSLSGGYIPIGVTMTTDDVWQKALGGPINCLRHTSTFGGNKLACVAGIMTIPEIIDNNLPQEALIKGEYLLERLRKLKERHKLIKDVRGKGLLIGIEFETDGVIGRAAYDFIGSMIVGVLLNKHRIITAYTLNNPTVVRLEPPLTIEYDQIDYLIQSLDDVLSHNASSARLIANSAKTKIGSMFKK